MTSISKTERLLQVLRTHAVAAGRRPAAQATTPRGGDAHQSAPRRFDLAVDVATRIQALAADAPDRDGRIVHAFLESCVAEAFGSDAVSDPSFQRVIDKAQETIRGDAALAAAMDRLVRQLTPASS